MLSRLLTERPKDAVDIFEDVSKIEKREKFVSKVDTLIDKPEKSLETKLAEIQRGLYVVSNDSFLFRIKFQETFFNQIKKNDNRKKEKRKKM